MIFSRKKLKIYKKIFAVLMVLAMILFTVALAL